MKEPQDAMFLEEFDATPGSMNDRLLDRMLGLLSAADVSALVYVAPVSPSLRADPVADEQIRTIETRMREKKSRFERPGLRIVANNPGRTLEGLEYDDYVHLIRTGNLIPTLVESIAGLAAGNDNAGGEL